MLRKGLILLAISLTVSLAAQAQAPAGGGSTGGGGTPGGGNTGGGTPGGGNNGGGRPGGGNNNGGFGQQQPQMQQQQQMEMQRPIFLAGNVILASGEAPVEPIMIYRVCGMQKTPEGYTDSKGRFSFQVGANQQFAAMDASIGGQGAASGFGNSGFGNAGIGGGGLGSSSMGVDLSGCQLEADAPGYRSDPIFLTRRRPMDRAEVGTFILTPLSGVQASVVSATSLAAPKKARSFFEKGVKELGKGPTAKIDRAMQDLQKAVDEYPEYAAAWTMIGQAKAQNGDTEGAIVALERALDADPRYLRPYESLVRLYIGKGDWEHTAELTKFVLSVNPSDIKMRWYQAVSMFEIGKDDDAITLLGEIQKDPESAKQYPQSHHILGLIYAKRGLFVDAAEAYKRYLELDPNAQAAEVLKKQLYEWEQLGIL